MTRFAAALLVSVLLVAACTSDGGESQSPSTSPGASASASAAAPSTVPSASEVAGGSTAAGESPTPTAEVWLPEWADAATPDSVRNRTPLRFCGIEQAPAPVPGEHIDAVVRACFWDAWQNDAAAEFVSVQSTMEGAPIATIWRTNGNGTLDLLLDSTQDSFGGGGWSVIRCRALVEDAEGNAFFGPSECSDPQDLS